MPLSPIWVEGLPNVQGAWERAVLCWSAYDGDYDAARSFLSQFGPVGSVGGVHRPTVWPPSYLVARLGETAEVCVAGTDHLDELLGHAAGVVAPELRDPDGVVNAAWASYWRDMRADVFARVEDGGPPSRVVVTGHSYGGGVAGIAAFDLAARYGAGATGLVSLGAPRYRGGAIAGPHPEHTLRLSSVDDPVPRVPPRLASLSLLGLGAGLAGRRSLLTRWEHFGFYLQPTPAAGTFFRGEGVEEPGAVTAVNPATAVAAHTIGEYTHRLRVSGLVTPPSPVADAAGAAAAANGSVPPATVPIERSVGFDPAAANRVYYGSDAGPIAPGNLTRWESTALLVGSGAPRPPADIGDRSPGGAPVATSGFTTVTLVINNSVYGHKESHTIALDVNGGNIDAAVKRLAYARCQLLGNSGVPSPLAKARGNPQIQFAILVDAKSPKIGRVLDFTDVPYFGITPSSGALPADFFSVALTIRMQGRSTGTGAPTRNTTLQIIGQPDEAVTAGRYNPTLPMAGGRLQDLLRNYVLYLRSATVDNWGFMGIRQGDEVKKGIDLWTFVAPYWVATVPAHGYNTGDRVRVTASGPVFNGVWRVVKLSADTIGLRKGPVSGHSVPPVGSVQRVGLAGGVRSLDFYPYYGAVEASPDVIQIKVAKHNPGREYLNVSFQRRVRRER